MIPEIERITEAEYLVDLSTRPLDEVRAMREDCHEVENAASYVRRFAQARLDMLLNMQSGSSINEIPTVLIAHEEIPSYQGGTSVSPRPQKDFSPNHLAERLLDELDRVAPIAQFPVAENDPEFAKSLIAQLTDFERSISTTRHQIHDVIDTVQGEVVRRYRDGEASVDGLLGQ